MDLVTRIERMQEACQTLQGASRPEALYWATYSPLLALLSEPHATALHFAILAKAQDNPQKRYNTDVPQCLLDELAENPNDPISHMDHDIANLIAEVGPSGLSWAKALTCLRATTYETLVHRTFLVGSVT